MKAPVTWLCLACLLVLQRAQAQAERRLVTVDPGHFHAALMQKEMLPGVASRAGVYAPLGPDLAAHLGRLARFNQRPTRPTSWVLDIHAGADYWERALAEPPGSIVVLSGRNRGKIDRIGALAARGYHVLADKPWIVEPADFAKLTTALAAARERGVVAYDAMTQRFEISCLLPRELVNDAGVFGSPWPGSESEPGVELSSSHALFKEVAGVPTLRPSWFFDIREQGEGLADVGTHLVDLIPWTLFPDQPVDYRTEIDVRQGERWATKLDAAQFQRVTGEREFPAELRDSVAEGRLRYFANNRVHYRLRGVHCRVEVRWHFAATPETPETSTAVFRGTRARVEVRPEGNPRYPQVLVTPNGEAERAGVRAALVARLEALRERYPGLTLEESDRGWRIAIPDSARVGHEEHFALLVRRYLEYVRQPQSLPAWETPNMLAKYYVTTRGLELARAGVRSTH